MRKAWNPHWTNEDLSQLGLIPFDEHLGRQTVTIMVMWFFGTKGVTGSLLSFHTQGLPSSPFTVWLLGLASRLDKGFLCKDYFLFQSLLLSAELVFEELWLKIEAVSLPPLDSGKLVSPTGPHLRHLFLAPHSCSHYISYLSQAASLCLAQQDLTNLGKDI